MKNSIAILFVAMVFAGCEKTVELKYKNNQSAIIIEANITKGAGPHLVKITKSLALAEAAEYPTIDDAVVVISDDAGNNETLTAKGNGTYSTTALNGVEGRKYILTVTTEHQTYTAQSTMPQQVPFDSVKVDEITVAGEVEYNLIPVYKDPVAKGNMYRFVLSINNKLVNQHFVQNDDIKNGVTNTQRIEINDDDFKLKQGDEIVLIMQCIDEKVGLFYKTLALMGDSGPGGGTTPNNPPGNISNGALGVFSAHTEETKRVTIR